MPGPDGKLTQLEKSTLLNWVNSKGVNHRCPVCNHNNWAMGEHLLHGQIFQGGNLVIGGAAYPQAFMVCGNCAYVRTFMAVPMGLVANPQPAEPERSVTEKPKIGEP